MATLRLIENSGVQTIVFDAPCTLRDVVHTLSHPCGGHGTCLKCRVIAGGQVSPPNETEKKAGVRLACQMVLQGDCEITLPDTSTFAHIETGATVHYMPACPMGSGYGAAVDVGTTTLAARLFDLQTGAVLKTLSAPNPQRAFAADVIGRIEASMGGKLLELQQQITTALRGILFAFEKPLDALVVTGNTVMLHLLTGTNPAPLARAPFQADTLFGGVYPLLGMQAYIPPCISAFVGADITCGLLAVDQLGLENPFLLADIGTNGELALCVDGKLYTCATAAGPALEGGNIRMGCPAVQGAIDKVWLDNGGVRCHALGEGEATGLCGSGVIDTIAVLLELGIIAPSGHMAKPFELMDGVFLFPEDVRQVQLAKAAIYAGIETLLEHGKVQAENLSAFYIAGGFGTQLPLRSAAAIGLIPETLADQAYLLGNAALTGASLILEDSRLMQKAAQLCAEAIPITLGGSTAFNDRYVDAMGFGEG